MNYTHWTPVDLPDLSGRIAVVTGANSGLGLHTSAELVRHGARVVMACRDPQRGGEALARVRALVDADGPGGQHGRQGDGRQGDGPGAESRGGAMPGAEKRNGHVELKILDLADLGSVRAFAAEVRSAVPALDLLVNNAGVMALPQRQVTADGFERQLGTNHLGHFALTGLLLPALLARPSRVVTVSSMAHRSGRIAFDDLQSERGYRPWTAYGQSKLANLLFTMELQRRGDAAAADLVSVAAHPGLSSTNLVSSGPGAGRNRWLTELMNAGTRLLGQSAQAGAWPSLYAAGAPDVRGAEFFGPGSLGGVRGHPIRRTAKPAAYDPDLAARLWERSAELTGVAYDFTRRTTEQAPST